jgi:transposase
VLSGDGPLRRQAARREHLAAEEHAEFLLGLIDGQLDLTLDEVVRAMRKCKIAGSRTAVWRFFQRHKITFKKRAARRGAGARGRGAGTAALDTRARHV